MVKIKSKKEDRIITINDIEAALGEVYVFCMSINNIKHEERVKAIELGAEMMLIAILDNDKISDKLIKSVNENKLLIKNTADDNDLIQEVKRRGLKI